MEYLVGQRWVSHADAQLGLGIVVHAEGRRVTLAFPAVGEERTYAVDRAPLSRLRFKAGDRISTVEGLELLVNEVTEERGLLLYTGIDHHDRQLTISELELDAFVQLTTPQQRLLNGHFDRNSDFALRVATFEHLDRLQRSPVRGLLGARSSLLPHQVYIAHEVGRRHAPRVLLADEVGLGKTIEAGMIMHQQRLTGRANRILVLVPPTLLHQWLVEMLRRFNLHFALYDEERLAQAEGDNPFEADQLVLSSLDLFSGRPGIQALAVDAGWDLVGRRGAPPALVGAGAGEDYRSWRRWPAPAPACCCSPPRPNSWARPATSRACACWTRRASPTWRVPAEEQRTATGATRRCPGAGRNRRLPPGSIPMPHPTIIEQILDRHGTGRVLFRNTRAVGGFPAGSAPPPTAHPPATRARRQTNTGSTRSGAGPARSGWTWTRGCPGWCRR